MKRYLYFPIRRYAAVLNLLKYQIHLKDTNIRVCVVSEKACCVSTTDTVSLILLREITAVEYCLLRCEV